VLIVGLVRIFQPDFPMVTLDGDAVATQTQKLKKLIPSSLLGELKPYGLAIDPSRFDYRTLASDLRVAAMRAGLVASGSLTVALRIIAGQVDGELPELLADPIARGLTEFALSDDYGTIAI